MSTEAEWWEGFFSGLWLEVQQRMWPEEQTRAQADFIERALQLPPRARVLDVPCGEGRLALEFASRGHQVTGVDRTLALLEDGRRKASERQVEIAWEHRDMRDLPWHEAFDGALCWWGSFGYFDEAGDRAFVEAVSRALKPGAKFVVDTQIAETLLPAFKERGWSRVEDILVLQDRRYDHTRGRVDAEWTLVRGGRVETRPTSIRVYTYRELCQQLERAGLTDCEGYGSLDCEPFRLGAPRLHLVGSKKRAK